MSWNNIPADPKQPLLFPDVDYPRQPNFIEKDVNPSVRVKLDAESTTPYRRTRDVDLTDWDDDAAAHLRSTADTPGDLIDCLSPCRGILGLRKPSKRKFLSLRQLSRFRRPFGVIWLVRDVCGIVCLVFTWVLILYAEFVISSVILMRAPSSSFCWITGSIYHLFVSLACISHIFAFSTDPGTVPIGNATREAGIFLCEVYGDPRPPIIRCPKCLCIKPPRAHHCRICFRCVRKMDHHCPWINNCVGEANQKYFVLFTLYICLQSTMAIYMCVHFVVQCIETDWEACQLNTSHHGWSHLLAFEFSPFFTCVFILGLIVEALVFGLFTMIMFITQVYSIADDETGIESLTKNGPKSEQLSRWKRLTLACGSPFSWRWFSPFSPPPPVTPVFPGFGGRGEDFVYSDSGTSTNLTDLSYSSCVVMATTSPYSRKEHNDVIGNGVPNSVIAL